ncbi:hypothetical protein [Nocardia concava]|uniref:hypothetical protein n=1 Tax=Nocardia concava TaxID=257281 RepID=UPI001427AFA8|nr:hypothetical protein [Nocardia concava]
MRGHLVEMRRKIQLLRGLDAETEVERRCDDSEDYCDGGYRLRLNPGGSLPDSYPLSLRELYTCSYAPTFGNLEFRTADRFAEQVPIDVHGHHVHQNFRLSIGRAGESSEIILDPDSGAVMIYDFNYFDWSWPSGIVLQFPDLAELISTTALGPRYPELAGPPEQWSDPWWEEDPPVPLPPRSGLCIAEFKIRELSLREIGQISTVGAP